MMNLKNDEHFQERLLAELTTLVTTDISDFYEISSEGKRTLKKDIPREKWAAVKEITVRSDGMTRIKLHSKSTIQKLLRSLSWNVPGCEANSKF